MLFTIAILKIENPGTREQPKVLAEYEVEAGSMEQARDRGMAKFSMEHPGQDWTIVYGKARPSTM